MRYLQDLNVNEKRVLLCADVNVPLGGDGRVDANEDWRVRAILPTLRYLRERAARVTLIGHLGRPGGKRDETLSLRPVGEHLSELLGEKVEFVDPWREDVSKYRNTEIPKYRGVEIPKYRNIVLLENLRFHPGEEANDPDFARFLASFGDVFVSDAFGYAHRVHASTVGVPRILPSAAGLLMESEVNALVKVRERPRRPFVVIIGGAKPETKLPFLNDYLRIADHVLVGGVLANVLLALKGIAVGESNVAVEGFRELQASVAGCNLTDTRLHLPVDAVISRAKDGSAPSQIAAVGNIERGAGGGADYFILDIGPDTLDLFGRIIARAATIVWNGPTGLYEIEQFRNGTDAIARMVVESAAYTVVGGGDSVAALRRLDLLEGVNHVSTGGGAMLEFLAGRELPGIRALKE